MSALPAVLVVDDNEENRDLLDRHLQRLGLRVVPAESGRHALTLLETQPVDLILLDIMMPGLNGFQVLEALKADARWRGLPVIMISALDDLDGVAKCIELGAEDYIFKPFKIILLRARVLASLEKKRLRDQEAAYLAEIQAERKKADELLLNILPAPIAQRLKEAPGVIADNFSDATVLFADVVDFTRLAARLSPAEVVQLLNEMFSRFDQLAQQHHIEKVKTIGDAYMLVAGVPTPRADHVEAMAELALAMRASLADLRTPDGQTLHIRIGMHAGPVTAGVIGTQKFAYDLWGDTVNLASRMESHGVPDCIQVSGDIYARLADRYLFEERGLIPVKGRENALQAYLLLGRRA